MRREFELTEEQLESLLDACKPVVCIKVGTHLPGTPLAKGNAAWAALGKELGFSHLTARPVSGKGQRFFTADVAPET